MLQFALLLGALFSASTVAEVNPSSDNCTWVYIEQPLSHFERGAPSLHTYQQRLCVYYDYWTANQSLPIFLYTGNESPVEEYVDNTGLLWNLAKEYNALVVFAEHRYFGESIPDIEGMNNCVSYLSSEEALADYAALVGTMRREWGAEGSAVIAFGGSYGGMLASWMRILYPSAIDGAIAASAPVWGFPLGDTTALDGSAQVVSYATSAAAGAPELCSTNLKASYVLLSDIGSTAAGRSALSDAMNLCTPLSSTADVTSLLYYLQSPLFNLAEGSYPFPSDYITFALTGTDAKLPPWAMQVMCEPLATDFGVKISGTPEKVAFTVSIDKLTVTVDWDAKSNNGYSIDEVTASSALKLISAAAQGIQVWYNVTEDKPSCIGWESTSVASSVEKSATTEVNGGASSSNKVPLAHTTRRSPRAHSTVATTTAAAAAKVPSGPKPTNSTTCTASKDVMTASNAWNTLCCNEGINLINWWAQGVGNDVYWPPNQRSDYTKESLVPRSLDYCVYLGPLGLYGIPDEPDVWSKWLDTVYGGERMQYVTNIVYSNGNLDPWMPAGITPVTPSDSTDMNSIISLVIDMGGHHLDLFFPTEDDPDSVKTVRQVESDHIKAWIEQKAVYNKKMGKK